MPTAYLIIGGTGGIGQAIVSRLLDSATHKPDQVQIFATYHQRAPERHADHLIWIPMDLSDEQSIATAVDLIQQQSAHLDWVINCAGMLHTAQAQPEKALRQLEPDFFMQNVQINALASLLIAKHIKPLLAKATRQQEAPAIVATLSARVGSITDNRIGGWYSYRMSKAALNMGIKTLSIEWQRSLKHVCVVALQPGTVDTSLSAPFQANVPKAKLFSPDDCARHLLSVLAGLHADQTGQFFDWAGRPIPW